MNILERSAFQRAERTLRPLMKDGERLLDFDIATSDTDPRVRVDFMASDRALYCVDSQTRKPYRFPYEVIKSVFWEPDNPAWKNRFFVTFHDGQRMLTTVKRGQRGLGYLVKQKVEACIQFKRHLPFQQDGKGATFSFRPLREDGEAMWDVLPDVGLDLPEADMDRLMKKGIEYLNRERKSSPT